MRLRKIKQADVKLTAFFDIVILGGEQNRGHWQDVFANNHPIYLEIGMGKGQFISEHARRHPDINYIGLEKYDSIVLKAAQRLEKEFLPNLRLLRADAKNLELIFQPGEITTIFLNFSDPWPKERHAKRRLTFDNFLRTYEQILSRPGIIELKTDNRHLFEYSLLKFNEHGYRLLAINLHLHEQANPDVITTEYEDKFINENKIIYYMKVEL
ncbi:MAG TPA: tRNA (guanosine(46)-N7)-methyltransferase TrmB [Bacilli bacterium]|nr:MAG: tRNA (guanine-N(7)-)-methyltransferase [Tenericutes bacterium ADurb.BinA124]HNZ50301.1 tRNA (guanosine(46)-N7)-methyltransferase TrmB [Bacilli bacterium]HOH17786.1 tRNA (guanosine(46)-N7)-methyltransferase TrmB [Bacilli bacterium]HPN61125.1 tRNA (guanosine(46)-N7)-methyltransferase TrmB [Bacilli bacterium]HPX83660.1 tRNA (guanosine(46)-N7)-methyltransferase TrmB [Bacilli bacterium]